MGLCKANREMQVRDAGMSHFSFCPRETGLADLKVQARLRNTDYIVAE